MEQQSSKTLERGSVAALAEEIRTLVRTTADTEAVPRAVADLLPSYLASPALLAGHDLEPDDERYRQVVLHAEPDGSFSVVALVWLPGQVTPVHDHLAWCVVGVVDGAEWETVYRLEPGPDGCRLVATGERVNEAGSVQALLPPGDIHRVANEGDRLAISLHIYGVDVTRVGSSIRRLYDLPIAPSTA